MSDVSEVDAALSEPGTPEWLLQAELDRLEEFDPRAVVGIENLGIGLAFTGANEKLDAVIQILRDLSLENWELVPQEVASQIQSQANALISTVEQMTNLTSSTPNVHNEKVNLESAFNGYHSFFLNQVRPVCTTARVYEVLRSHRDTLLGSDLSEERVDELREQLRGLEAQAQELQELAPLVEAQRELVGASGAAKLSHDYEERAKGHETGFRNWAIALVVTVILGGLASVLFILAIHLSDGASTAEVVSSGFLALLVVGLIVFLIRLVSLQARAHRHMQFIARDKANALSTFNRMVAGQQEPEVRAALAGALAQAIFKPDTGVFVDAAHDTVTFIERMGAVATNRMPTPGG